MERKKASDFPQELLNIFDRYVHGEIHRREFLDGAQKFAVGGVTATALFEMLRPNYVLGDTSSGNRQADQGRASDRAIAQRQRDHQRLRGASSECDRKAVRGFGRPREPRSQSVHKGCRSKIGDCELPGIGPHGLTSVGGYPGDDERGAKLFTEVDRAKMTEDFLAAATWLKSPPECTGKLGAVAFASVGALSTF